MCIQVLRGKLLPRYKNMIEVIRNDYKDFLNEYDFTQEYVESVLELPTTDDRGTDYVLELRESPIDGRGLFAIKAINEGEYIAMARVNGERMIAGRYTNHSPTPNAIFVHDGSGDLSMIASQAIVVGEEVTVNYRQAGEVNGVIR